MLKQKFVCFIARKKSFLKSRNKYLRNKSTLFALNSARAYCQLHFDKLKKQHCRIQQAPCCLIIFCSVISIFTPKITAHVNICIDYRKRTQVFFSKKLLLKPQCFNCPVPLFAMPAQPVISNLPPCRRFVLQYSV